MEKVQWRVRSSWGGEISSVNIDYELTRVVQTVFPVALLRVHQTHCVLTGENGRRGGSHAALRPGETYNSRAFTLG